VKIDLPDDLSPKAIEALEHYVACCTGRFTGSLTFHFTEGHPTVGNETHTRRYGRDRLDPKSGRSVG
jgi:hypothetical protein